mmetsp:Transcript_9431/g.28370  ORF Transcript_9431/g.28370 Transcript_9431/m.28370 type:complete len:318 (+) Transcript_9431:1097-2050(+)
MLMGCHFGRGGGQLVVLLHHAVYVLLGGVRILGQHLHRLPKRLPGIIGRRLRTAVRFGRPFGGGGQQLLALPVQAAARHLTLSIVECNPPWSGFSRTGSTPHRAVVSFPPGSRLHFLLGSSSRLQRSCPNRCRCNPPWSGIRHLLGGNRSLKLSCGRVQAALVLTLGRPMAHPRPVFGCSKRLLGSLRIGRRLVKASGRLRGCHPCWHRGRYTAWQLLCCHSWGVLGGAVKGGCQTVIAQGGGRLSRGVPRVQPLPHKVHHLLAGHVLPNAIASENEELVLLTEFRLTDFGIRGDHLFACREGAVPLELEIAQSSRQ